MPSEDIKDLKNRMDDLNSEYRAHKNMLNECIIDIDIAKIECNSVALREALRRKLDLEENMEDLKHQISRLSGSIAMVYMERSHAKADKPGILNFLKGLFQCRQSR